MNVEELFTNMVEQRASHLHLIPGSPIMMRLNNKLMSMEGPILSPADTQAFSESIMNEQLQEEFDERLAVDFSFSVPGLSRFRVNVFKQRGSVAVIISTNPPAAPTMEELGIPDSIKKLLKESTSGLFLVCGPKQSGKSNTLAAMVNYILEERTCQVISLEDPIDFLHKNKKGIICQREIGTDVLNYEDAFASLKHQSADVLVLGDLSNYQCMSHALELASSGTLVLAAATSPGVQTMLEKIIDSYPANLDQSCRNLIASAVRCVVSQVLLNKADGDGLIPCFEVLVSTGGFRQLMRENKMYSLHSLMNSTGRDLGMQTQEQALRFMVRKNLITQEEGMRCSYNPDEFKKIMSLPY